MKNNLILYFVLLFISTASLIQCSDPISSPPDIPIEVLLSSPDTVIIGTQRLVLKTELWRDFQPISPPGGKPLIAVVFIETVDSSVVASSIQPEGIYVVYNNQVWKTFFTNETPPDSKPYRIEKIAREGPQWGPAVYVDVIVRIKEGSTYHLLRVSNQYIGRTD